MTFKPHADSAVDPKSLEPSDGEPALNLCKAPHAHA